MCSQVSVCPHGGRCVVKGGASFHPSPLTSSGIHCNGQYAFSSSAFWLERIMNCLKLEIVKRESILICTRINLVEAIDLLQESDKNHQ